MWTRGEHDGRDGLRLKTLWQGTSRSVAALVCLALASSAGCSGNPGAPKTIPIKGKVTLNGKPLATGGEVTFAPKGGPPGSRRPGVGEIKSDGTYILTSYGVVGDGVEPGDYTVIVRPIPEDEKDEDMRKTKATLSNEIPEMYRLPDTSDLKATVTASDKGKSFDFDMKK